MGNIFSLLMAVAVGFGATVPALAQAPADRSWMWDVGMGWGGMMAGGALFMLLFWAGVVVLIVLLVRGAFGNSGAGIVARQSPSEILQERFARGEIDKTEYEERRRILTNNRT